MSQTPYVLFTKIARIDEDGKDLTPTLEVLNQIKLPFSDGNINTYYVETRTRTNDYFLFSLSEDDNTEPLAADKSTLSYEFTGSLTPGAIVGPAFTFGGSFIWYNSKNIFITSSIEDNLNFYNEVTEEYILETLPQKIINVRAKVIFTPPNVVFTAIYFGIFIIPQGATDLTFDPPKTEFNGINGYNPYLYKLSTAYVPGDPNPSTADFNVDIPIGHIPPGASIEIRAVGGVGDTTTTILAGSEMYISSTPAIVGPTLETIPEPYLLSNFEGTDCDVLLNNEELYRENPFLQDIDYSENPYVPVNFNLLLSGSAAKGTVPTSYYTALSQINNRYNGVKNQSSDFNIYDPYAGTSSFGDPINIGTYGQTPSVENLDNVIVEFEWAGGTNPEIPGCSQFRLNNRLFEVSSKELVKIVTPDENAVEFGVKNFIITGSQPSGGGFVRIISESRGDYYQVLNSTFGIGKKVIPIQYYSVPGQNLLPPSGVVIDNSQWVPGVSSFAGTSSYNNPVSTEGYGYWNQNQSYMTFAAANQITELGSSYNTDTSILVSSTDWVEEITYSLQTGNRWFITLIKDFEFPVGGLDASNRFTGIQNSSELNKVGVFEILGIQQSSGEVRLHLDTKGLSTIITLGTWDQFVAGLGTLGFLIWKSRSNYSGQFLTLDKPASGIEAGALYSQYPTDTITQNFESITKEYGSNPS